MAKFNSNNVTQAYGMGREYGDYIFYDGDPYDLISMIFADRDNYPTNARNALKNNRHISITIQNGKEMSLAEFTKKLEESFQNSF